MSILGTPQGEGFSDWTGKTVGDALGKDDWTFDDLTDAGAQYAIDTRNERFLAMGIIGVVVILILRILT